MRFVFFKTPKPKKFHIVARYHNPELERLRKRKAEMGYEEALTHEDELRMKIRKRWRNNDQEEVFKSVGMSRSLSFLIYLILIGGGIYLIFFTDFIDKLLMLFGVGKMK
jgi:maltodextrin utilization protein YvdJ